MKPCELAPIQCSQDADHVRCIHCGQLYSKDFLVESGSLPVCSQPERIKPLVPLPNIFSRFLEYAKSYAKYMASGQQQVTIPILLQRFQLCSHCVYYNDLEGACSVCGCYVNLCRDEKAPNKCLWACEACPLEKPKWLPITVK